MKARVWLVIIIGALLGVLVALGDFILLGALLFVILLAIILWARSGRSTQPRQTGQWRAVPQRTYGGLVRTERGEVVRSNSERRIADYLYRNGINYVYEMEAVRRTGHRRRISRPDFYLTEYGIYVEFWGLIDAEDTKLRANYERNMKWKMVQYHRNGIKFISLYPSDIPDLDGAFRYKLQKVSGGVPATASAPRFCFKCGMRQYDGAVFCGSCGVRL